MIVKEIRLMLGMHAGNALLNDAVFSILCLK